MPKSDRLLANNGSAQRCYLVTGAVHRWRECKVQSLTPFSDFDEVNARRKAGEFGLVAASVADEPPLLATRFDSGDAADAFGAALAEYLAASCSFAAPGWTREPGRFLSHPWWPLPRIAEHPRLRDWLEAHTPAAFREHNIYIDENSLVRV